MKEVDTFVYKDAEPGGDQQFGLLNTVSFMTLVMSAWYGWTTRALL